jgi:MFS family permease
MLADAAGTPTWGKLSDIWGRKPLLLIAAVIFFLGSTLCGAAVNIDMLIAGRAIRVLQDVGC